MGAPLGLQISIALCVGMVAATFSPAVRRSIPRWFEIALWVALIFVCWLAIASIREPHARELTDSVNWALGQIATTLLGLAGGNVVTVLAANRFALANAMVTLFGADLLALALITSYKKGRRWQPRMRLREWMEFPAAPLGSMAAVVSSPSAIDELNERWAAAAATAGAAAATWSVQFLIWARDIGLPRAEERLALAVAVGRVETKVWLESVRETAGELEVAARNLYETSAPEANKLAQVVDIQALRIAQALGRSGRATSIDEKVGEHDSDQLAS